MQISDLVGHYNNAVSNGETVNGTKGVERLVSSLSELSKGNIFEGTINSVNGSKITLGLSNGTQISARLDSNLSLAEGQSMFFQVKSNNGSQVEIRPYMTGQNGGNLTLLSALQAANLPVSAQNLSMVNKMMEEQMPIDKNSLAAMAKLVADNSDINVSTIVSMSKLDIPVNSKMAAQFENYMDDRQAISSAMEDFIEELPQAFDNESLSGEELRDMGSSMIKAILEEPETAGQMPANSQEIEQGQVTNSQVTDQGQVANSQVTDQGQTTANSMGTDQGLMTANPQVEDQGQKLDTSGDTALETNISGQVNTLPESDSILTSRQQQNLSDMLADLQKTGTSEESSPEILKELDLSSNNSTDILNKINQLISAASSDTKTMAMENGFSKEVLSRLFTSEEFKILVKNALEDKWTFKPKEVSDSDKINRLYEKMEDQLDKLENIIKATGADSSNLSNLASDIKSNINFMNQINEAYTYVQIPLKMSGQTASGQLYVYTNKKALEQGDKDLTAFLHLDMDHLGSTDVSVKMRNKNVDTNFYFDSDESYALVKQFLPQLEQQLKNKGYNCSLHVNNESKQVNFVDNFLKKDMPSAGQLHRYSFDMRA